MNWFTYRRIDNNSVSEKRRLLEQDGGCDHVEADINLAVAVRRENDSSGIVGQTVLCEACDKAADEAEDNEEHVCYDCKQNFTLKSGGKLWKWYDFYPAQGDEPLPICGSCRKLPTHLNRIARDRADYEREFGQDGE